MKMTYILKYISDINERGIELKENDLLLLLFIYEMKVVKQTQLLDFVKMLPNNPIKHEDSFYRRIKKMENEKLINRKKYNLLPGTAINTYLIEIEQRGLALLYLANVIDKFNKNRSSVNRRNIEHHIGIVESVLQMYSLFAKTSNVTLAVNNVSNELVYYPYVFNAAAFLNQSNKTLIDKKEQFRVYKKDIQNVKEKHKKPLRTWPFKKDVLKEKEWLLNSYGANLSNYLKIRESEIKLEREIQSESDIVTGLKPDWIFSIGNYTYFIEIDANTERNEQLLMKLKRYMELSEKDPSQHYIMFFIMLDDSLKMRKSFDNEEIAERLTSLKEEFFVNEISLRNAKDNLDVYVLPFERMGSVFEKVTHTEIDNDMKLSWIFNALNELNATIAEDYKVISKDEIESLNWFVPDKGELEYKIPIAGLSEINNNEGTIYFPYVLREGDIKAMDKICYFAKHLMNKLGISKEGKLLVIYEFEDEVLRDIKSELFLKGIDEHVIKVYCEETKRFYSKNELIRESNQLFIKFKN